jgi:endonuclease I
MKSDLHHVFPTDGYVNNRRGSYPFGEVDRPIWTSENGSMLGSSDQCDAYSRVFEPIDVFKGDVARALFYMSVRYRNADDEWSSSGATVGASMEPWAEEVLRAWHITDPPDAKEIDRNNAVASLQSNRNPFVDHPEWVCLVEDF